MPREINQEKWQVRIRKEMTKMIMLFMMEKEIKMARVLKERKKLEVEMNEKLKVKEKEKEKE